MVLLHALELPTRHRPLRLGHIENSVGPCQRILCRARLLLKLLELLVDCARVGRVGRRLGAVLGAILGRPGGLLGPLQAVLGQSWALLGQSSDIAFVFYICLSLRRICF